MTRPPTDELVNTSQLATLRKARGVVASVKSKMPVVEPHTISNTESKKGVRIFKQEGGHLSMSVRGHLHAVAEARFDVHMVDSWRADICITATGIATGLMPLLSFFFEPDLVADYLPKVSGLPYIENLDIENRFAENDMMYHCFVSPFGPLPGADDVHGLTFYDLMDEEEKGLFFYAESPEEGAKTHRGWAVPQVKSWRRKRNYVLGAVGMIRPSAAKPIELEPPAPTPEVCASPGCRFYAHRALSVGYGRYCCARCREHPCKHAKSCQRCNVATEPPPNWALAKFGTIDLEIYISLKPPIPTWLIPLAFVRFVIKHLVRLVYPYFLLLNEQFESTPFAPRVAADGRGMYRAIAASLSGATSRPHAAAAAADGAGGGPRFICRVDTLAA